MTGSSERGWCVLRSPGLLVLHACHSERTCPQRHRQHIASPYLGCVRCVGLGEPDEERTENKGRHEPLFGAHTHTYTHTNTHMNIHKHLRTQPDQTDIAYARPMALCCFVSQALWPLLPLCRSGVPGPCARQSAVRAARAAFAGGGLACGRRAGPSVAILRGRCPRALPASPCLARVCLSAGHSRARSAWIAPLS